MRFIEEQQHLFEQVTCQNLSEELVLYEYSIMCLLFTYYVCIRIHYTTSMRSFAKTASWQRE